MRIVFCGSGDFGIPTLRRLVEGGHEVAAVITQPPRPAGRGGHVRPTPLAELAGQLNLPVSAVEDINAPECVQAIAAVSAAVMVVADFGQMIRQPARQAVSLAAINLHGSLLPELRGAAPVNWAVIRGCARTGVTTIHLADRMDAGGILCQLATDISPEETAEELRARLAALGAEAVTETLAMLAGGGGQGQAQDESHATPAPRLKKTDGVIDWSADAISIRNRIHGTWPWPGGQARYLAMGGKETEVLIARARALAGEASADQPGLVGKDLTVAAGQGRLEIVQIQPAGRRLMTWRDFINGYRVAPGARFVSVAR